MGECEGWMRGKEGGTNAREGVMSGRDRRKDECERGREGEGEYGDARYYMRDTRDGMRRTKRNKRRNE